VTCTPVSGLAAGKLPPGYGTPSESIRLYSHFSPSLSCDLYLSPTSGFLDDCPKNRNGAKNIDAMCKQQNIGMVKDSIFMSCLSKGRLKKKQVAVTAFSGPL
jgi:hypothetical protein